MKSIGEFAKMNNVTVRALHHYEKLGLITPHKVDKSSGYRYYLEEQSKTLDMILLLKNIGFSLGGIKMMLENQEDTNLVIKSLESKRIQAMIQIDTFQKNYTLLSSILSKLKTGENNNFKEIIKMSIIDTKNVGDWENMFRRLVDVTFGEYKDKSDDLYAMSLDIDNFGKLNTDYGFDIGNEVIEQIYNISLKSANVFNVNNLQHYTIIERTGGDEFKLLIKDNKQKAAALADMITEEVKKLDLSYLADDLNVSLTIGLACITDAENPFKLLHYADTALLDAKNKNKGSYSFYNE